MAELKEFDSIHIFEEGNIHILKDGVTIVKYSKDLKDGKKYLGYLKSLNPKKDELKDFRFVHIFYEDKLIYQTIEKEIIREESNESSFRVYWKDIDQEMIAEFVDELYS